MTTGSKLFDFSYDFVLEKKDENKYSCTFEPRSQLQHASFFSIVPVTCEEKWITNTSYKTVKSIDLEIKIENDHVIVTTSYLGIDCL